jgi:hypothetical protein
MLTMKNVMRKNHQETEDVPGSQSGAECCFGDFVGEMMPSAKPRSYQASIDIAVASPNCFMGLGVPPLVIMGYRALKSSAEASLYQGAIGIATEARTVFKESGRDAASHDRLQYFDGIEQAQLGSSDDCHSDGNVLFALCGPVAKSDFPEKDTVADPGLGPVVCGLNRRVFKEDEEFVFRVISRLRMLSASWCDNGGCRYSALNLLRIAFLPERYSSAERMEY